VPYKSRLHFHIYMVDQVCYRFSDASNKLMVGNIPAFKGINRILLVFWGFPVHC
jgi:hypothetical protein